MIPRIVVAEAEAREGPDLPWLPVGLTEWAGAPPRLVIVVKAKFHYGSGELTWSEIQDPLAAPFDFIPRKADVDVLLTGHAFAKIPASVIHGRLRVGEWSLPFSARIDGLAVRIPLSPAHLTSGEPMGPSEIAAHDEREPYGEDFDFGAFNAAPKAQRLDELAPDAEIGLEGLIPGGEHIVLRLPGLSPVVTLNGPSAPAPPVPMRCDTLWIDTDREILTLTWRGAAELSGPARGVSRVVVSLERLGEERAADDRLAALQRGRLGFAVRASDPPGAEAPLNDEDRSRLMTARYQTFASKAPPPRMPLEEYAFLSALLAERPSARAETLSQRGLDEEGYMIEERAWLEKAARDAGDGDVSLADELGRLVAEAQKEVASPVDLDVAEYAEVSVLLDEAPDPAAVLRERGLSVPQWMRVDQRFTEEAARDPSVAAEIEAARAAARASLADRRA